MDENVKILKDLPLEALISAPLNAVITAQSNAALSTANFITKIGLINKSNNKKKATSFFDNPSKQGGDEYDVRVAKLKIIKQVPEIKAVTGVTAVLATSAVGESAFPNGMLAADSSGVGVANDGTAAHALGLQVFVAAKPAVAEVKEVIGVPQHEALESVELPFIALVNVPCIEISEMTWDFNVKLHQIVEMSTDLTISNETTITDDNNFDLNLGDFLSIGNSMHVESTTKIDFESRYGSTREQEYNLKIGIKAIQAPTPKGLERFMSIAESIATNNEKVNAAALAAKK